MAQKKKTARKRVAAAAAAAPVAATVGDDIFAADPPLTCATLALNESHDPYLPYGVSFARDLFLYHNPRVFKRLDTLVLQCGDLRDVARTFDDAGRKNGTADLGFVLSDTHAEVLARNLLVLHAIGGCSDATNADDLTRHVGQLTYSFLLEPTTRDFWLTQMRAFLDAT
ncbi:hypothetical protein H9P43_006941 [Blastocladiella emersonii ATCC 22665]|nr:hypothetical protein H9P43_006941 [Blastocladiella emersonii ATCC 22665]